MNYNDALKILNVSQPLLPEDIRKTYKSLVFKNHPDKYPSASDLEIEKQSKIMADINLAYKLILKHIDHGINGEIPSVSFDIFNFDFGGVSIGGFKEGSRIRKHPDHKSGAYQNLWHYIHKIQKDRHGLALRCWEKAIFRLLHDLPKYPDIDGIIHNYIRDCSSLLMRLDMFTKAFELIKVLVNSGACSYYGFDPPDVIVWRSILKSLKYRNSIACWEKQFIDKVVFDDIRVSWAMLVSYHFSNEYLKVLKNVESGAIVIPLSTIGRDLQLDELQVKSQILQEKKDLLKKYKLLTKKEINEYFIKTLTNYLQNYRSPLKPKHFDIACDIQYMLDELKFHECSKTGIKLAFDGIKRAIDREFEEHKILDLMLNDMYNIILKGLSHTGFISTSSYDLKIKYPKIHNILSSYGYDETIIEKSKTHTVNLKNSRTNYGLQIIPNPNLEYTENEVDTIWKNHFFNTYKLKGSKHTTLVMG